MPKLVLRGISNPTPELFTPPIFEVAMNMKVDCLEKARMMSPWGFGLRETDKINSNTSLTVKTFSTKWHLFS
jgi:hypothetical protein